MKIKKRMEILGYQKEFQQKYRGGSMNDGANDPYQNNNDPEQQLTPEQRQSIEDIRLNKMYEFK